MANTLDGTFISPFSNITLARFGGPWQFQFVTNEDVLLDLLDATDQQTIIDETFPIPSQFDEIINTGFIVSFGVDESSAVRVNFEIDISAQTIAPIGNINFNLGTVTPNTDIPVEDFGDEIAYDTETKIFKFPSRDTQLIVPEGNANFWLGYTLTFNAVSGGSFFRTREYQSTALFTFAEANRINPGKIFRGIWEDL